MFMHIITGVVAYTFIIFGALVLGGVGAGCLALGVLLLVGLFVHDLFGALGYDHSEGEGNHHHNTTKKEGT